MKKLLPLFFSIVSLLVIFTCDDSTRPNLPPIIVVSANPVSGVAPLTVSFSSSAEDADGVIAAYSWNFGDGAGSSTQQNPVYTYNSHGSFTATCTVSDNGSPSLSASATVVITVYQSKIPTLSSISPAWSVIHMPEFTLTATGTDFFPQSKIVFDGTEMTTTYISPTQLSCKIRPDDTILSSALKSDGSVNLEADQYTGVIVRNPGIGGGDSASIQFTIRPNHVFESPHLVNPTSNQWGWTYVTIHKSKNLYITYSDPSSGFSSAISASKDLGQNWENEHEIPNVNIIYLLFGFTAGLDDILYIFCNEYLYKSSDDGQTWSDPILVSNGTPDETCIKYWNDCYNIIRLDDGTLYAVWAEWKNSDCTGETELACWLLHSISKDGGLTWSPAVKIPTPSGYDFYGPTLFKTASGMIHCLFGYGVDPDFPTGNYHMTSSDGGVSWSTPVDIASFLVFDFNYPFVGDDDGLYVAHRFYYTSYQEIIVKYWLDGASTWGMATPITLARYYDVQYMSVSVDSAGNINLFYTMGPAGTKYAIYYQRSIDHGRTWTEAMQLSPFGCWAGKNSGVCDSAGNLYVVWVGVFDPYPISFSASERNQ
jgi:PKD repeat protein